MLTLSEDLDLSKVAQHTGFIKAGSIIEGASGFGKSELICQLLLAKGYKPCQPTELLSNEHPTLQNHFIQFTASGNPEEDEAILRAAFMKGCVVILDELNLSPTLDALLNHLMTGKTPDNQPADYPGFRVLTTQNSLLHVGRKKIKEGLFNRFHVFHVEAHDKADLCNIAQQAFPHMEEKEVKKGQ